MVRRLCAGPQAARGGRGDARRPGRRRGDRRAGRARRARGRARDVEVDDAALAAARAGDLELERAVVERAGLDLVEQQRAADRVVVGGRADDRDDVAGRQLACRVREDVVVEVDVERLELRLLRVLDVELLGGLVRLLGRRSGRA